MRTTEVRSERTADASTATATRLATPHLRGIAIHAASPALVSALSLTTDARQHNIDK
jgi:hypothetical protein